MVRGAARHEKDDSVAGVQDAQQVDYGQAQMSGQLWNPEACDHVFKAVAL